MKYLHLLLLLLLWWWWWSAARTAFHQNQVARRSFRLNKELRSNEDRTSAARTGTLRPGPSSRKDKNKNGKGNQGKSAALSVQLCASDRGFAGDFLARQSSVSGLLWSFCSPPCQRLSTGAETSGWKRINVSAGICSLLRKNFHKTLMS